jgi:phosphoglycolate phosphatase-like HAD superfamily hydrolase
MTLHVFDFDGVLFDTARECLMIAFETARRDDPGRWSTATPSPELAAKFLASRHVVGPPWQYAVLLDCIATGSLPPTTEAFVELARTREEELSSFTDRYFATRAELSRDVARWCGSLAPYTPVLDVYRRLHHAGTAVVLSTRDDHSIRAIFRHFTGFEPRLLPRAGTRHKWELLADAADHASIDPRDVWFLDDYAGHAIPAHLQGFSAHLALWGYLGPDDIHNARSAGVVCVELTELDAALARHEETTP